MAEAAAVTTETKAAETVTEAATAVTTETKVAEMKAAGSVLAATEIVEQKPNSTWPDDWRTRAALGDEKRAKRIETYGAPEDFFKAHWAAVQRIEAGEVAAPLPDKATPEQIATYRQKHGIPETPDKYDLTLPDGLTIGANDKPMVDDYLKLAHERHLPPAVVKDTVGWFFQQIEAQKEARVELDHDLASKTEEILRADMGADYRTNINVVNGWIDTLPEAKRDLFRYARLADGAPIGADPDIMKWMIGQARQINPISLVVPGVAEGGQVMAIETEMATLAKEMGDPRSAYWVGSQSKAKQARFAELSAAAGRMKRAG